MKKEFIFIPVCAIMAVMIGISIFLIRTKPDTANINKGLKIAEYAKPAVVKAIFYAAVDWTVESKGGAQKLGKNTFRVFVGGEGSGAIISEDGYIVTNAHVVEAAKMDENGILEQAFQKLAVQIYNQYKVKISSDNYSIKPTALNRISKVALPGGKILDAEIKSYGAPVGDGKDVAVIKVEGKHLPTIRLGNSSNVKLQDNIWVFGYPAAADSELLSQDSQLVATITEGKVSAIDKKSTQGSPVLQVSAAATHGNSGGPVIAEDGSIVGLLTFRGDTVNGQEVQGFNFAVPVNTVKEYVNQSGAKTEPGEVDKLYEKGLELYWGGYYTEALKKFEDIQRLFPEHSEVRKLITDCQSKSASSKILWSQYTTWIIAIDVFVAIVLILVIIMVMMKKENETAIHVQGSNAQMNITYERPAPVQILQGNPVLYGFSGYFSGSEFPIGHGQVTIGRDPSVSQIIFPQDTAGISRRHCAISYDRPGNNFILQDIGSSNGTFLESGEKMLTGKTYMLKEGNRFYLAERKNMFEVRMRR